MKSTIRPARTDYPTTQLPYDLVQLDHQLKTKCTRFVGIFMNGRSLRDERSN